MLSIVSVFLVIIFSNNFVNIFSQRSHSISKFKLDPNYIKVISEYKKLETIKSKDEMKMITTLGVVAGALQIEREMEDNLTKMIADLVINLNISDTENMIEKINKIESTVERDKRAIEILGNALDLARKEITMDGYRGRIKRMFREFGIYQRNLKSKTVDLDVRKRLENMKTMIRNHMDLMHKIIGEKTNATVDYLENKRKLEIISTTTDNGGLDSIEDNLIDNLRRQDGNIDKLSSEIVDIQSKEKENQILVEGSEEIVIQQEMPGGILGLIAGLSGGEEGSDVGALLGALTGVVMNLFGPGGLDIPSLLSSGTSLLAGLLSGNRNFGTVLGEYVGTAVDGFSGGGGAINNGQFFGNFLGTLIAELSADPEDDDEPPKPSIFIQNFINSFLRAKSKSGGDDADGDDDQPDQGTGSNSFAFITHIVRALVGGVTSFVLNASLGSSGGSSTGSASLSAGSSNPHPKT